MRIAYLECFSGISGDMLLGALVDAGVPPQVMLDAIHSLNLGATLAISTVDRSGISSTKVDVVEMAAPVASVTPEAGLEELQAASEETALEAETAVPPPAAAFPAPAQTEPDQTEPDQTEPAQTWRAAVEQARAHRRTHSILPPISPFDHQEHAEPEPLTPQPEQQHQHMLPNGEDHSHDHAGAQAEVPHHPLQPGRSLTEIRALIDAAPLAGPVKQTALRAFKLLGHSEARIHNLPVDQVHFHEVGAVDAIVDIVAASAGIHHLEVTAWYSSPVNVGGGTVECAHGTFPVPAPATADLLRGFPTYSAHVQMELVTPTGAALLRALDPVFGTQPAMRVAAIGYGAGSRDPQAFPNVLRLQIGDADDDSAKDDREIVSVLETALDDLSPQLLAHVAEKALAAGALDVMLTPVIMKKGRPGTLLTLIAETGDTQKFEDMLLRETSTLGVRVREDRRVILDRSFTTVDTPYGEIAIKVGSANGVQHNMAPEFEDCRAAATRHGVPVKLVQQAAIAAYHR